MRLMLNGVLGAGAEVGCGASAQFIHYYNGQPEDWRLQIKRTKIIIYFVPKINFGGSMLEGLAERREFAHTDHWDLAQLPLTSMEKLP